MPKIKKSKRLAHIGRFMDKQSKLPLSADRTSHVAVLGIIQLWSSAEASTLLINGCQHPVGEGYTYRARRK